MLNEAQLNRLFQYAMALCHERADALDLLQASVEKYLIELQRNKQPIDSAENFTRKILRNKFIDQQRHQQRWAKQPYEEAAVYDISPTNLEDTAVDQEQLSNLWRDLDSLDRDILYHWAVLGFSSGELADKLEMPRGTLLSRIHRLRQRLNQGNYQEASQ